MPGPNSFWQDAHRPLRVTTEHDPWFLSMSAFLEGAVLLGNGRAGNTRRIGEVARYGQYS
jgi:hypothetical protein